MIAGSIPAVAIKIYESEVLKVRNLIKKKMIDAGRDDFVNYLAEILNISKQAASAKLNGDGRFNENDISILTSKLEFTGEELKNAVTKE